MTRATCAAERRTETLTSDSSPFGGVDVDVFGFFGKDAAKYENVLHRDVPFGCEE